MSKKPKKQRYQDLFDDNDKYLLEDDEDMYLNYNDILGYKNHDNYRRSSEY